MTKVTNISNGPRGIHDAKGNLVMLEARQSDEIGLPKDASEGEWFKFGDFEFTSENGDASEGEWFKFGDFEFTSENGVANEAALVQKLALAEKRADDAETMLALVQDELAAIKRSAPVVSAAVMSLNHENNDHWTAAGEPKVDAVKAIVGGDISRDDIDAAAPGFNRAAAKAAAEATKN